MFYNEEKSSCFLPYFSYNELFWMLKKNGCEFNNLTATDAYSFLRSLYEIRHATLLQIA